MDRSVDPLWLAGVRVPESKKAAETRLQAQQAELIATARRELRTVASVVLGKRFASLEPETPDDPWGKFVLADTQGGSADLWIDAIPMATGQIANTVTNTTSDQYIVRISDRLPSEYLTRVLAHEVGELIAVRDRSSQGLAPVRESLLSHGAEISERPELSSQDHGRVAELNWLAGQASDVELPEQQRAEARSELSAMLDRCGLRPVADMAEADGYKSEVKAARLRYAASREFLSSSAERLVSELARPIEHLDPTDAAALHASRDSALRAERQVEAFIGRREVTIPTPGYDQNGLPLPRGDQLKTASKQWAVYRAQVSERTVETLEGQVAAGQLPQRHVVIGGGASLTGRDPNALLVDGVGRWHLDPGAGIVQSADQDRDLAQSMGVDPYEAVDKPRDRVSIHAVRVWEDQLATQGDLVNGHARLRLGRGGELFAEIRAFGQDGKESETSLWVECRGRPSIATGLTPEVVPGMPRGTLGVESRSEAVRLISDRLRELEAEGATEAQEMRAWLTNAERGGLDARTVLDKLNSSPLLAALKASRDPSSTTRMGNCFTILEATQEWEAAREAAPGRVLMGDEVADNRFDPRAAEHWIIAGSGGTGVANAEIILRENPEARVTIVGSSPPPALEHQVQYPQLIDTYAKGENPRLIIGEGRVGVIEAVQDAEGRTSFRVPYKDPVTKEDRVAEGGGYVASLGRTNPLPPALQVLANEVRDRDGEISGDLLFDKDDQYIGYGLTFSVDGRQHRVDVDGAASWQLPREIFAPETGLQQQLNEMGARGLPAETGNAAPGFAPIARQSALRARAVAAVQAGDESAVQRRSTIPERWRRPDLGQEAEAGTETGTEPPGGNAAHAAPPQEKDQPRQHTPEAEWAPRPPAPAPTKPAPERATPGKPLWETGMPERGTPRIPRPTTQQPQQPPPGHERPGPGVGMGD